MEIQICEHFYKRVMERSEGISIEKVKQIFEEGMKEWRKKKPAYIRFTEGKYGTKKMYYNDHKFVFYRKSGGIYELKTYAKRSQIYGQIVKKCRKYEKSFDKQV